MNRRETLMASRLTGENEAVVKLYFWLKPRTSRKLASAVSRVFGVLIYLFVI